MANIDLKNEQIASLERPRCKYSVSARIFFFLMDLVTGFNKITLAKTKLIEMLASIPYRSWEIRLYGKLTFRYKNRKLVNRNMEIMEWSREAQDNEYWHLLVINEKMKEDNIRDSWYLWQPIPFIMILFYIIFTRLMAVINIKAAFRFNAEFEDHAEHVYAQFVKEHPEWEDQKVKSTEIKGYGEFNSWADVFRRIGLDERDHRNNSFSLCGKPELIVKYEGMPVPPASE